MRESKNTIDVTCEDGQLRIEPLPRGLVSLGSSVYFKCKPDIKDVVNGDFSVWDYITSIPRKINDYLLDNFH